MLLFFFKQKTAYEMRISDWSSDVCSSDLDAPRGKQEVSHRWTSAAGPSGRNPEISAAAERKPDRSRRALPGPALVCFISLEREISRKFAEIGSASCRVRVCQSV